jgi:metallo-beta-lactamase family protein
LPQGLNLSFHGAAGTVTGSKHLLRLDHQQILLDAGMFQGKKELRLRNWEAPGFDPAAIDKVLLSHTHIDHIGYLPRLVKEGLTAPVYMTPAAFDLAELMLLDAAKIQEEDARYAARKGFSKHKEPKPLFDTDDARAALDLRQAVEYEEWLPLDRDGRARARFLNSGHLLGAAFIEVRIEDGPREITLVYSGDVGRFEVPLHLDPEPLPSCDVLILESTYGDRDHNRLSILEQIREPFLRTLDRGGTVLIPAFAVGRSQQVTLMLRRLMKAGALPEVPIHLDSPMAINATQIYGRFLNEDNVDPDVFEDGRLNLFPENVHFHRTVDQSKELNELSGPRVVISSSGMLTGGRILHHLKRLAPDPRNLVLLAGYQAVGTRGRTLADGATSVKVHGQYVPIECEVASFRGLSGHADRGELLRWVESAPRKPELTFLVHGEPDPASALKELLHEKLGLRCIIPALEQDFELRDLLGAREGSRA